MSDRDVIARLRRMAEVTTGPGMKTTISGAELRATLRLLDEEPDAPPAAPSWTDDLPPIVDALAEIIESRSELWGCPAADAVEALLAQRGESAPEVGDIIARCSGGGG